MDRKKREPRRNRPDQPPAIPATLAMSEDRQSLPIPDRRWLESTLRELTDGLLGVQTFGPPDSPLAKAQQFIDQAIEEPDADRRVQLSYQALSVCPDCADAYVLLAECENSAKDALGFYEQGVAAGRRALGEEAFEESVGHFWLVLATRPYMRARIGLATTLWAVGRRDEAVEHLQEMLRLNPNDSQGVRHDLIAYLLYLNRDAEAWRLLEEYKDESSAAWAYGRVLLSFRRDGDTAATRKCLKQARRVNRYVSRYLLGVRPLPHFLPDHFSPGDSREAKLCAADLLPAWRETPGAITWLRGVVRRRTLQPTDPLSLPAVPVDQLKKWQRQPAEIWQVDARPVAGGEGDDWENGDLENGDLDHGDLNAEETWMFLAVERNSLLAMATLPCFHKPDVETFWRFLTYAMAHPFAGFPHRPSQVELREPWATALTGRLAEIAVRCAAKLRLGPWNQTYRNFMEMMPPLPRLEKRRGLLETAGVSEPMAGEFYTAAAEFYRRAPWRDIQGDTFVRVEFDAHDPDPWYASVMGQSGMAPGLALHDDYEALTDSRAADYDDEERFLRYTGFSVSFGEREEMPDSDLESLEKNGWPVATPEGYPWVFHKEPGIGIRPPLAWELCKITVCLRAIPDFVAAHGRTPGASQTVDVDGTRLVLTRLEDDE